ncbi:DUF6959 family protein [Streptomyces griseorubiginosus]|uniref:DUF6959 family protein n=1 Tax=Streptomyces griseorubiginosus TaxID=67304 RepID=UPI00364515E7
MPVVDPDRQRHADIVRGCARLFKTLCGDSLHILRSSVAEVMEACERGDLAEARDSAGLLLADLEALLGRYEAALGEHGMGRPY